MRLNRTISSAGLTESFLKSELAWTGEDNMAWLLEALSERMAGWDNHLQQVRLLAQLEKRPASSISSLRSHSAHVPTPKPPNS